MLSSYMFKGGQKWTEFNNVLFPYMLDVLVLHNNTIHFMLFFGKIKKPEVPNELKLREPYVYPFLAVHF